MIAQKYMKRRMPSWKQLTPRQLLNIRGISNACRSGGSGVSSGVWPGAVKNTAVITLIISQRSQFDYIKILFSAVPKHITWLHSLISPSASWRNTTAIAFMTSQMADSQHRDFLDKLQSKSSYLITCDQTMVMESTVSQTQMERSCTWLMHVLVAAHVWQA